MKPYTLADIPVERIEQCLTFLQDNAAKYAEVQSSDVLITDLQMLLASMAFVNEQMAKSKQVLNVAKTKAYQQLRFELKAIGETFSPMLAKDYINSSCIQEAYAFDICERCSRTIVHTIDSLRTCISALKEQFKNLDYVA